MSITDELRKWVKSLYTPNSATVKDEGERIADRIDAEHEKAMSRAGQLLADAEKDRNYNYANWQECKQKVLQGNITFGELNARIERLMDEMAHRIELPKDADGEYIHVGDEMEPNGANSLFGQASFEVRAMRYDEGGWEVYDRLGDRYAPSLLRHHHAPTVEDVLREFAEKVIDSQIPSVHPTYEEAIAEYAGKLRLAKEDA